MSAGKVTEMLMPKYNFKSALQNTEDTLQKGKNVKSPHPDTLALLAVSVSTLHVTACDDSAASRSHLQFP